jgi:predicted alpha/beta hydrolase
MRNTEVSVGAVSATLWEPDGEPEAALVFHSASATPQGFYAGFASYLAGNGIATVTYDYRGTGRSGSPRTHRDLGMRDWMEHDVPAVAAWTADRFPGLPHLACGHSLGGQALALGHGVDGLAAFAILASYASPATAIQDPVERFRVRLVLDVLGPALAATLGYVPARRLGLGEDIPAAAMRQWGRWARLPGYFFDDPAMRAAERAATVTQPVLAVAVTDDKWATPAQVDLFAARLTSAAVERRDYSPADAGRATIGHHGLLRRAVQETLWPDLLAWLRQHAVSAAR